MINYNRIIQIINENDSFLLTTHINPDGDAIGSELALYHFLKKLNKNVYIINHSSTPDFLEFLDKEKVIKKYDPSFDELIKSVDVIIAVDFNHIGRIRSMMEIIKQSKAYKILIDHHQDPQNFVNEIFTDTEAAATGILIYKIIENYDKELINKKIAEALYAAIMTDTGSFRFERITSEIHLIVAELIDRGVNPTYVYNKIYNELPIEKLKILGELITKIQLAHENKIAFMVLTNDLIKKYYNNNKEFSVDEFVNFTMMIKSVRVGILFYELPDTIKVSLRSKGTFPVNQVANVFGGGGHINAAGIRFDGAKLYEVINNVISEVINKLENFKGEENND